jgi:hypothetical protein
MPINNSNNIQIYPATTRNKKNFNKHFLKRFGRLIVLKLEGVEKNKTSVITAVCDCGDIKMYVLAQLVSKNTQSCGCLAKEIASKGSSLIPKMSKHPLYAVWASMKKRTLYSKTKNWHRYGGRGITVCEEWLTNSEEFIKWSLENGYKKGLDIDRIDNDKGYNPDNCRYVTHLVNSRNKNNHRYCLLNNKKMIFTEVDDLLNKKRGWLSNTIKKGKLHLLPDNLIIL